MEALLSASCSLTFPCFHEVEEGLIEIDHAIVNAGLDGRRQFVEPVFLDQFLDRRGVDHDLQGGCHAAGQGVHHALANDGLHGAGKLTANLLALVGLEDPIEYVFEDNQCVIEQREVGLDTLSFHHALKHILRQDPDIIMIGEMRDSISFTSAMSAADTGHLVLSTLHTTNASQSISRILDFFKADEREQIRRQLAGTMQAVVCQRMVTTLAGSMTPALEIMINTPTVKKLIEENRLDKLAAAIETGIDDGMINFNQALFNLVKQGKVSEQEALLKASNPQALEMNFKGIFLDEGRRILT